MTLLKTKYQEFSLISTSIIQTQEYNKQIMNYWAHLLLKCYQSLDPKIDNNLPQPSHEGLLQMHKM